MSLLFTFGSGTLGELGTAGADETRRATPLAVGFPSSAPRDEAGHPTLETIALGIDHSLAAVGGHAYRWGLLGANMDIRPRREIGSEGEHAPEVVPQPISISELVPVAATTEESSSPDGRLRAVECGGSNSFLLTHEGEVFVLGSLRPPAGDPRSLRHLWGNPRGGPPSKVVRIAAGWRHCLVLTEAGRVFALGDDEHGQCAGVNTGAVSVPLPTQYEAVGVAAGACHSVAWDSVGAAFAWGHGGSGRLGLGGTRNRRTPAQVEALQEPVRSASCGGNFTIFVTRHGQSVWACGGNQYAQLGLGGSDRSACEKPVRLQFPPLGWEVASLECGANHALCLVQPAGKFEEHPSVWAWGCASSGQCGLAGGEPRGAPPPALRSAPTELVDFSEPSSYWPLAVAAGRSHSAVLAHHGRPANLVRNRQMALEGAQHPRRLPEAPEVSSQLAAPQKAARRLPQAPNGASRKLPEAPHSLWTFPEGGSISHIHGMHNVDNTSISPSRLPSAIQSPEQVHAASQLVEDDIIDMFCAGLEGRAHETPPLHLGARQRSPSPIDVLVKLGEAALGGDVDMTAVNVAEETQLACTNANETKSMIATGPGRMVHTGTRQGSGQNVGRSLTPQRGGAKTWPRPPPSWSVVGKRRSASQTGRQVSRSPRSKAAASPRIAQPSMQSSIVQEKIHITGVSGIFDSPHSGRALPQPPPPAVQTVQPAVQRDQWTGIHESLKGLSSMIANIGAAPVATSPLHQLSEGGFQEFDSYIDRKLTRIFSGDVSAGGGNGQFDWSMHKTPAHAGAHARSATKHETSQAVLEELVAAVSPCQLVPTASKTPSPEKTMRLINIHASTHHVKETSPQLALQHPLLDDSPRECGSDTALDFSPRSTGSSPKHRQQGRRSLTGHQPVRGSGARMAMPRVPIATVPIATVNEAHGAEPRAERSMFVLSPGVGEADATAPFVPSMQAVNVGSAVEAPASASALSESGRPLSHRSDQSRRSDRSQRSIRSQQLEPQPPENGKAPRGPPPMLLENEAATSTLGETLGLSPPNRVSPAGSSRSTTSPHSLTRKASAVSVVKKKSVSPKLSASPQSGRQGQGDSFDGGAGAHDSVEGISFVSAGDISRHEVADIGATTATRHIGTLETMQERTSPDGEMLDNGALGFGTRESLDTASSHSVPPTIKEAVEEFAERASSARSSAATVDAALPLNNFNQGATEFADGSRSAAARSVSTSSSASEDDGDDSPSVSPSLDLPRAGLRRTISSSGGVSEPDSIPPPRNAAHPGGAQGGSKSTSVSSSTSSESGESDDDDGDLELPDGGNPRPLRRGTTDSIEDTEAEEDDWV